MSLANRLGVGENRGSAWLGLTFANGEFVQVGWSVDTAGLACPPSLPGWFVYIYHPPGTGDHDHEFFGPCGGIPDGFTWYRIHRNGSGDEPDEAHWDIRVAGTVIGYAEVYSATGSSAARANVMVEISTVGEVPPNAGDKDISSRFDPAMRWRVSDSGPYSNFPVLVPAGAHPPCPPSPFSEWIDQPANVVVAGSGGCGLI